MRKGIIGLTLAGVVAATPASGPEFGSLAASSLDSDLRDAITSGKAETVPFYETVYVPEPRTPDTSGYELQKQEWTLEQALADTAYWNTHLFESEKVPKALYIGEFKPGNVLSGFALRISQQLGRELGYVELWQQNRHLSYDMRGIPVGAKVTYAVYWPEKDVNEIKE